MKPRTGSMSVKPPAVRIEILGRTSVAVSSVATNVGKSEYSKLILNSSSIFSAVVRIIYVLNLVNTPLCG
jgi:hypothetical protein